MNTNTTQWPISGQLLDALSRRDFAGFEHCLADDARLRAVVPSGPFEIDGAAPVVARFRTWFGGSDDFAMLEASAADIGAKHYLRWRIRLSANDSSPSRVAEQHLFTTGSERIETIDLVCSGFQPETEPPS